MTADGPGVYRAPMRSRLPAVDPVLAVERALDLGLVGVGGRLSSRPRDLSDAVARVSVEHDEGVARRLERFAAVADGAEMWTRDPAGLFHRGVLDGPWRYDADPAAHDADLTHVRPCAWDDALAEHRVPAAVAASFRRGGLNFQRVRALGQSLTFAQATRRRTSCGNVRDFPSPPTKMDG